MANLGNVAIKPKGEWVIGVVYKPLNAVTHNGNLYLALQENAIEPINDGVNWWLILEGVKIATVEEAGKSKPDGKTITIDEDGTLHGASQVPDGVTYVDLDKDAEELPAKLPVDADTLGGYGADYFAFKADVPEAFDYNVPADQNLTFANEFRLRGRSTGGFVIDAKVNNAWEQALYIPSVDGHTVIEKSLDVVGQLNVEGIANLDNAVNIKSWINISNNSPINFNTPQGENVYRIILDATNTLIVQHAESGGWRNIFYFSLGGVVRNSAPFEAYNSLSILNNIPINFYGKKNAGYLYRLICTDTNNLVLQRFANNTWINTIALGEDGIITNLVPVKIFNDSPLQFLDPTNRFVEYEMYSNSVHRWVLRKRNAVNEDFYLVMQSESDGTVTFGKNISAPNIPSATALTETEQEITELDLQNLTMQQRLEALEAEIALLKGDNYAG